MEELELVCLLSLVPRRCNWSVYIYWTKSAWLRGWCLVIADHCIGILPTKGLRSRRRILFYRCRYSERTYIFRALLTALPSLVTLGRGLRFRSRLWRSWNSIYRPLICKYTGSCTCCVRESDQLKYHPVQLLASCLWW